MVREAGKPVDKVVDVLESDLGGRLASGVVIAPPGHTDAASADFKAEPCEEPLIYDSTVEGSIKSIKSSFDKEIYKNLKGYILNYLKFRTETSGVSKKEIKSYLAAFVEDRKDLQEEEKSVDPILNIIKLMDSLYDCGSEDTDIVKGIKTEISDPSINLINTLYGDVKLSPY